MFRTDMQLQRDVMDELRWDPAVGQSEIGVAVKDGVVTLSGEVETFAKRFAAMKAVERVVGVRAVAGDIHVHIPAAAVKTDTEIAHAAATALDWDVEVPVPAVKARVQNGWVWLEGEVDWQYQRIAAERAVQYLVGVKGVTNGIRIAPQVSAPDVKKRIETALQRSAEVEAKHITVEALDGKVTLRGTVHSFTERRDAEAAAWSAPGVHSVKDELAVV
jgi:osmotically-inducible protein OsmY